MVDRPAPACSGAITRSVASGCGGSGPRIVQLLRAESGPGAIGERLGGGARGKWAGVKVLPTDHALARAAGDRGLAPFWGGRDEVLSRSSTTVARNFLRAAHGVLVRFVHSFLQRLGPSMEVCVGGGRLSPCYSLVMVGTLEPATIIGCRD